MSNGNNILTFNREGLYGTQSVEHLIQYLNFYMSIMQIVLENKEVCECGYAMENCLYPDWPCKLIDPKPADPLPY